MRRTKIVCTLGPASSDERVMENMLQHGMNVARLNFSHGTHEYHKELMDTFRAVRDRLQVPAAVLLDTKGPEIRIGTFEEGGVMLAEGSRFVLTTEEIVGDASRVSVGCKTLPLKLKTGDRVLLDDGRISLIVDQCTDTEVQCTVRHGGELKDKKGINVPHVPLDLPYLSEQDKADLLFGIDQEVDFIAASFVRRKEDVIALRRFLDYNGGHSIRIISKIENLEGIENFDEILKHSDGIMVARGDMGVEVAYEKLPGLQKKFIKRCYQAGKMVITATQMLESMVTNPMPTRAEITDVANAVFDGTSAVMLSGESAAGKYPVQAVRTMAKIVEQAEEDAFSMDIYKGIKYELDISDTTNAVCDAACTMARDMNARAIIAVTKYGHTARRMSKFRPREPIVAATPVCKTYHQLSLSWGVCPVMARCQNTTDELFVHAIDCAKQLDLVANGDRVVITAGVPLDTTGTTNTLKVQLVNENEVYEMKRMH